MRQKKNINTREKQEEEVEAVEIEIFTFYDMMIYK